MIQITRSVLSLSCPTTCSVARPAVLVDLQHLTYAARISVCLTGQGLLMEPIQAHDPCNARTLASSVITEPGPRGGAKLISCDAPLVGQLWSPCD